MEAEKPLPPESPGKETLRQEGTVKRSSFLYEGQGTERRQRSSLPQVPDMEKQAGAVPWGAEALRWGPSLPTAPAAASCSPPTPFGSPSRTASPERLKGLGCCCFHRGL